MNLDFNALAARLRLLSGYIVFSADAATLRAAADALEAAARDTEADTLLDLGDRLMAGADFRWGEPPQNVVCLANELNVPVCASLREYLRAVYAARERARGTR